MRSGWVRDRNTYRINGWFNWRLRSRGMLRTFSPLYFRGLKTEIYMHRERETQRVCVYCAYTHTHIPMCVWCVLYYTMWEEEEDIYILYMYIMKLTVGGRSVLVKVVESVHELVGVEKKYIFEPSRCDSDKWRQLRVVFSSNHSLRQSHSVCTCVCVCICVGTYLCLSHALRH